MDAMNTKEKAPQAEARSESRIAAALEGLGCHGSGLREKPNNPGNQGDTNTHIKSGLARCACWDVLGGQPIDLSNDFQRHKDQHGPKECVHGLGRLGGLGFAGGLGKFARNCDA